MGVSGDVDLTELKDGTHLDRSKTDACNTLQQTGPIVPKRGMRACGLWGASWNGDLNHLLRTLLLHMTLQAADQCEALVEGTLGSIMADTKGTLADLAHTTYPGHPGPQWAALRRRQKDPAGR